jgi:hypothetical protein
VRHRTVRCTSGATAICAQRSTLTDEQCSTVPRQKSEQQVRVAPDCPVWHRTVRCHMRTKPPTVDQLQALTTRWRGGAPDTVRCAHRQQPSPTATIWLVAINTTPTGHFKVGEPKQHSKSYSWHTQALPTTSIHWSILYTRFRPLQTTQVPQKREQAKESLSCEFSSSALWDSLRESVCYILHSYCAWSFDSHWTSSKVLEACKASKRHLSVWWSLRVLSDPWEEEELVDLGDRLREGKGWKRTILSGLLNGD